ncbi:hypothetical protein MJT46_007460 [Ovis ammon polii x Ovis aries]|nr:hypothetical protein MJT46_007460 [Ovis ammon polii x Ovis aries]
MPPAPPAALMVLPLTARGASLQILLSRCPGVFLSQQDFLCLNWSLTAVYNEWLAALKKNPSCIIAMIISPKPFKDLRHRARQGFRSYRDPPQFVTGESLTAVVCDSWFPKMIPILQHVCKSGMLLQDFQPSFVVCGVEFVEKSLQEVVKHHQS